jgi:polyphosphate kinase
VHIGTGNYHPRTARVYEDFGLLTTNPRIGDDVANLFNYLSGYSQQRAYDSLLVAPHSVRSGLVAQIQREIEHAKDGRPARIRFKCNAIVDEQIIDALYRASQAGVEIDLLVRGICALRPGVPGLSDNIRVRSVLGRFLEHSRVFEFFNDGDCAVWIGSADLMHRNLDRRVEVLVKLVSANHVKKMRSYLDRAFSDAYAAWTLDADGEWTRHTQSVDGTALADLQEVTIALR